MLYAQDTRRMRRVGACLAFAVSILDLTVATRAAAGRGRPGEPKRGTGVGGALRTVSAGRYSTQRS